MNTLEKHPTLVSTGIAIIHRVASMGQRQSRFQVFSLLNHAETTVIPFPKGHDSVINHKGKRRLSESKNEQLPPSERSL